MMYAEECQWSPKNLRPNAAFACLGALGPLGYVAFLTLKFHDPLAFASGVTAKDWGADMTLDRFVRSMNLFATPHEGPAMWMRVNDVFHVFCLVVAVVLTGLAARRMKAHVVVFCVVTIVVQLKFWANAGRYVAPIFPLYAIAASHLRNKPNLTFFVLAASVLFMGVFAYLYGHGHWVS